MEEIANPVTIVDDPVIPKETPSPLFREGFHTASAHVTFAEGSPVPVAHLSNTAVMVWLPLLAVAYQTWG